MRSITRSSRLRDRQLLRLGHQRLEERAPACTGRSDAVASPASSARPSASQSEIPSPVGERLQPRERGVPHAAPRPVRDPRQRHGVVRVVDRLQVGDRVLDLGALVEARPADHLVGDPLPDEHVLEHAALRVRAVDDRDLAEARAGLDEPGDLGGDEPRLGVLVLDLDHAHGLALAELRPEALLLALAVVLDHRLAAFRIAFVER